MNRSVHVSWTRICGLAVVILMASGRWALAAVVTWQGPDGGGWETTSNWNGLAAGQSEPGANDDVVIPGNSGTIKITAYPARDEFKKINSLDMRASTAEGNRTVLTAGGDWAGVFITAVGGVTITGVDPQIGTNVGIRVGQWSKIEGRGLVQSSGGSVRLKADVGQLVLEKRAGIRGGKAIPLGPGADPDVVGYGGLVSLKTSGNIWISGELTGGEGGDTAEAGIHAGRGGNVSVISADGTVTLLDPIAMAIGGSGGKNTNGTGAGHGGDGGNTSLISKSGLRNFGEIRGGASGAGIASAPVAWNASAGSGGIVSLRCSDGTTGNHRLIVGGEGQGAGGRVSLRGKWVTNGSNALIRGGKATTNRYAGGEVKIEAAERIWNDPNAVVEGGQGGSPAVAGPGGAVSLKLLNEQFAGVIVNAGAIRGGAAGVGPAPPPAAFQKGADVTVTSTYEIDLQDDSSIEGGKGSQPGVFKPRGDVTVEVLHTQGVAGVIKGPNQTPLGNPFIQGKRILARVGTVIVEPSNAVPAGAPRPPAVIDFSDLRPGAIEADERICLDAGTEGIIDLTGICAGSDALVVLGDGKVPGEIHMLAEEVLLDDHDTCTGDRVTLDEITSPDAVVETRLCECCNIACPADLDMDGDVDGIDLAMLLGTWGACPQRVEEPCPADLNGDGVVNGQDTAALLAAWGPC